MAIYAWLIALDIGKTCKSYLLPKLTVHLNTANHRRIPPAESLAQEVEGSTPTGGTCPNDFSDPVDQDIPTRWALSWKIVVSEWRSVIAVSLNVGGGVRLIKPAQLYMCTQKHFKHNEDRHTAPGVCGNGSVPLSHSGNVLTRMGIHTHTRDTARIQHEENKTKMSMHNNIVLLSFNLSILVSL